MNPAIRRICVGLSDYFLYTHSHDGKHFEFSYLQMFLLRVFFVLLHPKIKFGT